MREVDAETPVIWPAWCYSGSGGAASDQGGGGGVRPRAPRRRPAPPAHNGPALDVTTHNNNNNISSPLHIGGIKSERLSPHNTPERSSSRSRSVTPSTCSFPGTPPQSLADRGPSPAHPASLPNHGGAHGSPSLGQAPPTPASSAPAPHALARNYSDFMRSLAAKYNNANNNDFFGRTLVTNGLDPLSSIKAPPLAGLLPPHSAQPPAAPAPPSVPQNPVGGMFANYSFAQGGPKTVPAFPSVMDMSSTKALYAITKMANAAKESEMTNSYNKGTKRSPHNDNHPLSSPLDLSSAANMFSSSAAKKSRTSPKHEPGSLNESASSTGSCGDGQRSPGMDMNSLSIKGDIRNGSVDGLKFDKSNCGSVRSEAASPASSGRKTPGSTGRKSPGSSTGRDCANCCRSDGRRDCSAMTNPEVAAWSVDDVCKFVESIDICAEYSTAFREQRIDGAGLPLLTEDHLTGLLRMKLGPALKLRALLAARMGGCNHCRSSPSSATAPHPQRKSPAPGSPTPKQERPSSAGYEES